MFKHILVPTDGSDITQSAIPTILQFAKDIGAKVTAVHVAPQFHVFTYQTEMLEDTRDQFARDCAAHAKVFLANVEAPARALGLDCDCLLMESDRPHEALIQAADERGCDLIAMASRANRGVKALLLGSETHKVLVNSEIPVLVFR